MDKLILRAKDIDAMLAWRDQHKAEVRSMPAPLRAVEMIFPDSDVKLRAKCIRFGEELTIQPNINGRSAGRIEFHIFAYNGKMALKYAPKKLPQELIQDLLTVYATACALMVYAEPKLADPVERAIRESLNETIDRKPRPPKGATYLLRRSGARLTLGSAGHHASPRGQFTVRGHYRHYKSGKVVWIAEYRKGTGKKKPTTYALGNLSDDTKGD